MVYYGSKVGPRNLSSVDLAILDPDQIVPREWKGSQTKFIGYLSVGEAESYRAHWPLVKEKKFLLQENPNWKGSYWVDIRSPEWQELLLERVIPPILDKGYGGLFLDTVDMAIYLEKKNSKKYAGSEEAMIGFIKEIKKRHPQLFLIMNNGLELLEALGGVIDAVAVEDLYTRYDFEKKQSLPTPPEEREYKERLLDPFLEKYKKPVLNILYETSSKTPLARESIRRSEKKGYHWYLTTVDLNQLGTRQH